MTYATTHHLIHRRRSLIQRLRAGLRDTWVLMREFREALIFFNIIVLIGAITFGALWNNTHAASERIGFFESLYDVLSMIFFQPTHPFPAEWYLAIYYFIMPALGLALLARGSADFITLLFNRSSRQAQWEEAVASVFNDHVIVCGLGHLGVRVVRELVALDEEIVIIERRDNSPRVAECRGYDIPVIVGDARQPDILEKAGIHRASAIIVCTNDDFVNLQMATRIRELNPDVRLVMRMFDDEFARSMSQHLNISAVMSASLLAAPAFAGAASRAEIIQTFKVGDRVMVMGRIEVQAGTRLDGLSIGKLEEALDLSVILHQCEGNVEVHPDADSIICSADILAVVGELSEVKTLATRWNRRNQ